MHQSIALTIGLRYTRAKRRNGFISFISLISMLGLVLGVAVLIIVLSVMNGFDRELRERILGMVPHASIKEGKSLYDWQELASLAQQHPQVEGVAPFVHGQGMFTNRGRVHPVLFHGILPSEEAKVSILPEHMQSGQLDSLQAGDFNIIMGSILAEQMRLLVGDKVTLIMPEANLTVAGVVPRMKRFTVSGIFAVGAELDANLAVMHLADASKLKRLAGQAEGIRLKLFDLYQAPQVVNDIANSMPGLYWTSDWTRTHGNLFQAIQMERRIMGLLLMLIIAVATFNIVSTLVMLVVDKQGDIAVLRTLGATPATVMGIFVIQGAMIGFAGVGLGCLIGLLVALNITDMVVWFEQALNFQVFDSKVYFISYVPSDVRFESVVLVAGSAIGMALLATLYPAWKASKVDPAEALRYE